MTDVIFRNESAGGGQSEKAAPENAAADDVIGVIELIFFAYRDFTSEPDHLLEKDGFGRAHHRIVHFVHRNPGLRVADLLDILKITKQSLGRVLRQLVERGYIEQREGVTDRRERRLYTTARGEELARTLAAPQRDRIAAAMDRLSPEGRADVKSFLLELVNEDDRAKVRELVARTETPDE